MNKRILQVAQVDVFAEAKLEGNGLAVVFDALDLSDALMLDIAREFKQFETIFLGAYDGKTARARIFTMDGELPFAGHPILGGAAALHDRHCADAEMRLDILLAGKTVPVVSVRRGEAFSVEMRQGAPVFLVSPPRETWAALAATHDLSADDLDARFPLEVVTTGLPYLLIPVKNCLHRARIVVRDLEETLARYGAAYAYLFDVDALEARTWDNLGLVEDSATGSAAGPLCAYLVRHGALKPKETVAIRQGRYVNRPGVLRARMEAGEIYVSGDVHCFLRGTITV